MRMGDTDLLSFYGHLVGLYTVFNIKKIYIFLATVVLTSASYCMYTENHLFYVLYLKGIQEQLSLHVT